MAVSHLLGIEGIGASRSTLIDCFMKISVPGWRFATLQPRTLEAGGSRVLQADLKIFPKRSIMGASFDSRSFFELNGIFLNRAL